MPAVRAKRNVGGRPRRVGAAAVRSKTIGTRIYGDLLDSFENFVAKQRPRVLASAVITTAIEEFLRLKGIK